MSAEAICESLKEAGMIFEQEAFVGFVCVGHVWDVFPKYKEGSYFYRCSVFEKQVNGESIRVIMHDEGSERTSFVCPGNEEAMDQQINDWFANNELVS